MRVCECLFVFMPTFAHVRACMCVGVSVSVHVSVSTSYNTEWCNEF